MNIYVIAKEAGVSISTVSRVLNDKGYVSAKTKARIQEVLKRNKYQPSAIARGLVSGTMKNVAIVTVDVRHPHYAMTTFIMEQKLTGLGYMVLVCNTGAKKEECMKYLRMLSRNQVEGVILVGSEFNELCDPDELSQLLPETPIVMANGELKLPSVQSILVDEGYGVQLAVQHLYDRGHRNISFVMDTQKDAAVRKRNGFLMKMKQFGYDDAKERILYTGYGVEGGEQAAKQIVGDARRYDAAIFTEDLTAIYAMNTLQNMGYRIPEDIAVIGCNNSEYSRISNPPLTTINNKGELLSELSVQLLENLMTGKSEKASLIIRPELVVRQTT